MTAVEFYDRTPIENVISSLTTGAVLKTISAARKRAQQNTSHEIMTCK